jgi:DNA-binding MarR family transcriptional regulator
VTDPANPALAIRASLNRKSLADARHRAALATRLALTETEVLAVQHLARAGQLTPGQLGAQLQLSSGGTTGVIKRLQRAGHITRHAHPRDHRSTALRLTPTIQESATEAWAPLITELDQLIRELPGSQREAITRFLARVADAAEQHADRLARDTDARAQDALAVPLPALWA